MYEVRGCYIEGFKISLTSLVTLRSARKGVISDSSVSWMSLNHEETGTALWGWKMYDAGELSRMMVSPMGLPSCDKSYDVHPGQMEGILAELCVAKRTFT